MKTRATIFVILAMGSVGHATGTSSTLVQAAANRKQGAN